MGWQKVCFSGETFFVTYDMLANFCAAVSPNRYVVKYIGKPREEGKCVIPVNEKIVREVEVTDGFAVCSCNYTMDMLGPCTWLHASTTSHLRCGTYGGPTLIRDVSWWMGARRRLV